MFRVEVLLTISIPRSRFKALAWAVEIVFGRLGILPNIQPHDRDEVWILHNGSRIVFDSVFPNLTTDVKQWHKQKPSLPLSELQPDQLKEIGYSADEPLPVLFGSPLLSFTEDTVHCGVDIFGSIFFMLSGFEEICSPDRDAHDRFPATASLAWQAGFLYRPLVDEYIGLLWLLLRCNHQNEWPRPRPRGQGSVLVTCDVDEPFDRSAASLSALVRTTAGDIIKRKSPGTAVKRALNFCLQSQRTGRFDVSNTFDWYMSLCEKEGHTATFYFIADHTDDAFDGIYDIFEPRIADLMRLIAKRGHKIGMHGSYHTYQSCNQLMAEKARLSEALTRAGLGSDVSENRQHYLRWDAWQTPDHLDAAGFSYDSTGGFADRPGFKYGTSHEFPMWSWQKMGPLLLRQRPLIVMEGSVLSPKYLGLTNEDDARALMIRLKKKAMATGGVFTFLWHNSELQRRCDRTLFRSIL